MRPHSTNKENELLEKTISRALGEELRRRREELGWSRLQLVDLLPSGIGDRTLLSYEHGTRHHTTIRFIEICRAMQSDASRLLGRSLQRAQIHLDNLDLEVNLRALLNDRNEKFRPMHQWARNTLNDPSWAKLVRSGSGLDRFEDLVDVVW
jgi:hypothetical protein